MNYKRYRVYFALLCGLITGIHTQAQDSSGTSLRGKVTDNSNRSLAGVTVKVQEESNRTVTAPDGSFVIRCDANDVLVFSKGGFNTVTKNAVHVIGSTVVMEPSATEAGEDDDIYIPFGVRKKRALTYAVS